MRQTTWTYSSRLLMGLILSQGSILCAQPLQTVIITEIMALNDGSLLDEDGDASDWIELYNPTQAPIDMDGWSLTDKQDQPAQWIFPPNVTLSPGDYLVVFASGKDRINPNVPLHTNFKLSGSGEYLALIEADGVTTAYHFDPRFGEQLEGISYGTAHHTETILSSGSPITYNIPEPAPLNADWAGVNLNDTTWLQGEWPLRFGLISEATSQDIGAIQAPGSIVVRDDVYVVAGGGADIGGNEDAFHYVYQPLRGDGELIARIAFFNQTNAWAKAGVMIRETLDADSKHAMCVMTGGNGASFQGRVNTGQESFHTTPGNGLASPAWVRIVRQGSKLTAYSSEEGQDWTVLGTHTIDMPSEVFMGLCVASHLPGALCVAAFDNVSWDTVSNSDLMDQMLGQSAMVQARCVFNLEEGQSDLWDQLTLSMQYQDGFAVYLNGQLVTKNNIADALSGSSTALTKQTQLSSELIDLMPFKDQLIIGKNVLAIAGFNDHPDDLDFDLSPQLVGASSKPMPQYFSTPTPGADNLPGSLGQVSPVMFSQVRGFHSTPFVLSLQSDSPGAQIRITIDGSCPTSTHGLPYTTPLPVARTTVLKAVAYQPGFLDSKVITHTYLFLADVVKQSPKGERPSPNWPNGNINGQEINYGMDPEVVNDAQYRDTLFEGLLEIPSMSVVTDLANLFNPSTGIYVNAAKARSNARDWERPASIELLSTDESTEHKVRIANVDDWTSSRQWERYPSQKSKPITLVAGRKYYIEALHKEGGGGDNLAVAWQYNSRSRAVIAGQYLAPTTAQWTQWAAPNAEESTWTQATGILGYDVTKGDIQGLIDENIQSDMLGINTSCLVRIPFTLAHTDFSTLNLGLRYDDGVLVYLNGVECLRVNYDDSAVPAWNSSASQSRPHESAITPEYFDLSMEQISLLSASLRAP